MYEKRRKRIWVQHVAVGAESLQTRLDVAGARGLTPEGEAVARRVAQLVEHARDAALRKDPIPGRWWNWWRGTLVEASYRNLHAARAEIIDLYDEADLQAEARSAIARAQETMRPDDPRNLAAVQIEAMSVPSRRATLRQLVQHGYDAIDQEHAQLRSFRNVVLIAAVSITVLTGATIWFV